jgi:rhamnose utilization protein RhaD (predicted bifunctional aldolase and dehydrogenase)/NAD(P)-dependent dehydrogenase (short-subunit alcohol dehydrogenase family)
MRNRWRQTEGDLYQTEVEQCVYCTRLVGSDPTLVLHGGGNSSVKSTWIDVTGRKVDALYVKGTGVVMATISASEFTPLALERLHELLELDSLTDADMMRELSAARLDPDGPKPSVEALLHAFLPHPAVLHSHADAVATLTNLANGEEVVRQVFGDSVVVIPYVMPGFDLAREVRHGWPDQAHAETRGMVLLQHGLFTFGSTSREAYERHVELIDRAERWLDRHAPQTEDPEPPDLPDISLTELASLRQTLSDEAGRPLILQRHADSAVRRFVARPDLASLATRGPLTPDHVIRTKPTPMVGRDVGAFAAAYAEYFAHHAPHAGTPPTMLDPAPRVVLDRELGMVTAGPSAHAAQVAADIYHHTIPVLERAEDYLGGYVALPPARLFEVEYWELEQSKLRAGDSPALAGTAAIVTGAASGIGRACADALLAQGAAVAGLDISPEIESRSDGPASLGIVADATDPTAVRRALRETVEAFGGVDIAVMAAGVFGRSEAIARLDAAQWRSVMDVNVTSAALLLAELHPLLARSPVGGRVVMIGSKNVGAPGRGAASYSASKAAFTQLARVAALEFAEDGIRVNVVHPDAVFDTGLWTPELLAQRAAQHDLGVEAYKRRNLLRTDVTSDDVARVVVALCDDTFRVTTGAQVPVDGGNERIV